ncbi:MAG: hypothetical protein F4103_07280 [Boseongicola sp. SB0673_bin_14]|nr:hypothetical protein [Boseongicola sp. SB0673_bin_14]
MISVVVPDTGPLISLGLVGRLDLIDRFKGQILITDAVRTELLDGRPSAPEREALAAWITAGGNRLRIVETPSGSLLQRAFDLLECVPDHRLDHERRKVRREMRNAGGNSIRDLAEGMRGGLVGDTTGLVLFEDRRVRNMDFGPRVRRLSTWSFALALEALDVIPSAEGLFDQIERAGRMASRIVFDRRGSEAGDDFAESYDITRLAAKKGDDGDGSGGPR